MAEHKIHCPSCDQHLAVPEELAGQKIDCPACNKPLAIPDFAHTFDEPEEEEPAGESRQSPALIAGIVAGVLLFGGLGVYLLMGPGDSADEPEVATRPATQTIPPSPEPQTGANPGAELDTNDPFGMGVDLDAEIKVINERLAKGEPLDQYNEFGQTELMIAVEANDGDLVKRLLERNVNLNATDKLSIGMFGELEQTALHLAASNGNRELCELLVEGGAIINQKDKAKCTALDSALVQLEGDQSETEKQKYESVVAYLKEKGGSSMTPEQREQAAVKLAMKLMQKMGMGMMPGMMPPGMNPNDPSGMGMMPGMMNPFGMGMDPFGMGMMDPEEEIKAINERLAKGLSLNRYNEWGQTELMIAVEAEDIDLARRLLENKAHPNATSKDSQLDTALHLAAMQENKAMCELLLDKGARVNKKNKMGFTPLDAALYANEMPGFGGTPEGPSAAGQATVALLKSKGGTSMTPEERAKANPGMGGGMMPGFPGGMPGFPDPFMPPGGNPFGAPKGNQPPKPQRP